jgi:hypothetical protein
VIPYRSAPLAAPPSPHWWKRPLCWLTLGHTWKITRILDGCGQLRLVHPLAGCDAHCTRCGKTWLDYDSVKALRKVMFPELAALEHSDVCPTCKAVYVNVQHPMKPPGVSIMRTCNCVVTTQPIEGGGDPHAPRRRISAARALSQAARALNLAASSLLKPRRLINQ